MDYCQNDYFAELDYGNLQAGILILFTGELDGNIEI